MSQLASILVCVNQPLMLLSLLEQVAVKLWFGDRNSPMRSLNAMIHRLVGPENWLVNEICGSGLKRDRFDSRNRDPDLFVPLFVRTRSYCLYSCCANHVYSDLLYCSNQTCLLFGAVPFTWSWILLSFVNSLITLISIIKIDLYGNQLWMNWGVGAADMWLLVFRGSMFLRNVCTCPLEYMASRPRIS